MSARTHPMLIGCFIALFASSLYGQIPDSAGVDPDSAVAIEISNLAEETGKIGVRLRTADAVASPDPNVTEIVDGWAEQDSAATALTAETEKALDSGASDTQLAELLRRWKEETDRLELQREILAKRIDDIQKELDYLESEGESWILTRTSAVEDDLPSAVVEQIDTILTSIDVVASRLGSRLDAILELDARISLAGIAATDAEVELARTREEESADWLIHREAPLWQVFSGDSTSTGRVSEVWIVESITIVGRYLAEHLGYVAFHFGLLVILLLGSGWLKQRVRELAIQDESLQDSARIFEKNVFVAVLIALIATQGVYPVAPESVLTFATLLSIPITIYLLYYQLPRSLYGMLYGIGGLVILFALSRATLPYDSTALRLSVFGISLVSLFFALVFLRSGGATDVLQRSRIGRFVIVVSRVAVVILTVSLIADILGFAALAQHSTGAAMRSTYFGLYYYIGALILSGVAAATIESDFVQNSRTLSLHKSLIRKNVTTLIYFASGAYWVYLVLRAFGVSDPLWAATMALLDQPIGAGNFQLSLLDVMAFVITLVVSFKGAQFVRAVLDEDVLSRMSLSRGIPTAISGLTFYALIALGFLFALSAAGLPLDRLALITGALGIGVGFGLQDVVRNFVSGLILMVERPIKPGDRVDFGIHSGVVQRIGMRSSIIRNWQGADLVVPNSLLTASLVENWTMDDELRRIDVNMTMESSSDPKLVQDILLEVGNSYEGVVKDPEPEVVFTGLDERGMDASLRCWVDHPAGWLQKRNDLMSISHHRLTEAGIKFPSLPAIGGS